MNLELPKVVYEIGLENIKRIDLGLEGSWSDSVVVIWSRESGFTGFESVTATHPNFKHSLELYFDGYWVGIHCFKREQDRNVFDEQFAKKIIDFVQDRVADSS